MWKNIFRLLPCYYNITFSTYQINKPTLVHQSMNKTISYLSVTLMKRHVDVGIGSKTIDCNSEIEGSDLFVLVALFQTCGTCLNVKPCSCGI